jgi:hypothetical protein
VMTLRTESAWPEATLEKMESARKLKAAFNIYTFLDGRIRT